MATIYKVLGQVATAAVTDTTLYTVPAATSAVVSTLSVCNRGSATSFRIAIRPGGATLANQHYVAYNSRIDSGDSIFLTLGVTLATTDVVTVYAASANISFSLFGSEIA